LEAQLQRAAVHIFAVDAGGLVMLGVLISHILSHILAVSVRFPRVLIGIVIAFGARVDGLCAVAGKSGSFANARIFCFRASGRS
jgi:uncharacterized membrane protein